MRPSKPSKRVAALLPVGLAAGGLLLASALGVRPSAAQFVRPWSPPSADSLLAWSAEARARFQSNQGDSAQGANYRAYELVGKMGRHLLHSLGEGNFLQAHAIKSVLDSLKLDTEVALDPTMPRFVLLMVHNPFRPQAASVGFLYWPREDDLRMQGVSFMGGRDPSMRVWWTARSQAPYEWLILSHQSGPASRLQPLLLRLDANGYYWNLIQYEGNGPDLGEDGTASLVDLNSDNVPEIVSWLRVNADSTFTECPGCPSLITERVFAEHDGAYRLQDSRLLPSPYATFVLFIRLLRQHNRAAASRLLENPAKVDEAIAQGWGGRASRWSLEYAEASEPWPQWLAIRFLSGAGRPLYVVHFSMRDDRWIIHDWLREAVPGKAPARVRAKKK